MIRGRCPTCSQPFEIEALDALPSFPFCSHRCKLIDLGRWIEGDYAIPGASLSEDEAAANAHVDESEPDDA
jgi:uncharacterized protein